MKKRLKHITAGTIINGITALCVTTLFAVAFFLSFQAIKELAADNGISHPLLYPLVVDFSIIVFAMFRLRNSLQAASTKLDVPLVLLATLISVAFNVAHAPDVLLSQFMAGLVPVALFASFELLMWMLQEDLQSREQQRREQQQGREQQWRQRTRSVLAAARNAAAAAEQHAQQATELQEANTKLQSRLQQQATARRAEAAEAPVVATKQAADDAYVCACGRTFRKHQALAGHSRHCDVANAERATASVNGHA